MSPPTYSIIPGAALQFIDYDLDLSLPVEGKPLADRRKPFFVKMETDPPGLVFLDKVKSGDGDERYVASKTGQSLPMHYEVATREAFECCLGRWLPLPFLERSGVWSDRKPRFGYGPTDWVRVFLSRLGDEESLKYRLTLVFDPQVEDGKEANLSTKDGAVIYHALSESNVNANVLFALAADQRDYGWFVELPWVNEALRQNQEMFRKKNPKRRVARASDDFPDRGYEKNGESPAVAGEYLAVYAAFLEGLALSGRLGEVRLVKPDKGKPIEVDLVLDIGNSRLTGVLVETLPKGDTKLTNCYILPVRDLSEPAQVYMEPVSSQVEFAEPYFGQPELSLDSRLHAKSFLWPSTVRLGPEAARLAADSREDQGPTGMSSPKRYLWDTRQRELEWFLNNKYERHGRLEERATGRGAFLMEVNAAGIPLSALSGQGGQAAGRPPLPDEIKRGNDENIVAFESRYSRSSLMMFLLSEVVAQALSAVNDPVVRDGREYPNKPRRLSRIILTVPTAMPLVEQNIFKTWAELAVETVWSALNWDESLAKEAQADDFRRRPLVRCDWDEATCTQVVWLYNEIRERFHNNADELFDLLGRRRVLKQGDDGGAELASLRLASIDMGAGTTDLSITTYALHNPGQSSPHIKPHLEFREGFNVAGDDIMHKIIKTQFRDKITQAAAGRGLEDAKSLVEDLFRVTTQIGGLSDERNREGRRSQFVTRVAVPLALEILRLYEGYDHRGEGRRENLTLREVLGEEAAGRLGKASEDRPSVLSYLEKPLREAGWADFSLLDQALEIDLSQVDDEVNSVLEKVMTDLAEVVKLYDCDLLILTGRPSRWPAMRLTPYRRLCLPVDRIVHMHKYRVSARYPFVTHGRIEDPKTTVVIGAIICALAEGSLEGLIIDTSSFEPQPTTRHLGLLDARGHLNRDKVWFSDIDVYADQEVRLKREIQFNAPVPVGFRQLSCQRWTTTRLYSLEYKDPEFKDKAVGRLPYTVELEYTLTEPAAKDESASRRQRLLKRTEGKLKVLSITDKHGQNPPPGALTVRLQTLRHDDGYWLDTGVLGDD